MTLGDRLAALRVSRGLSQEQLSEQTGLGLRTIGDIERGVTRRPHRETLRALLDGLSPDATERAALHRLARTAPPPSTKLSPARRPALPAPTTPLVGRADDLAQLTGLLQDPVVRLVTVTGPGGVGKSRLASEAAWRLAGRFERVAGLDLSSLNDPDDVAQSLANTLGARMSGPDPADAVATLIGDGRWLLVLDSFEHVSAAARGLADLLGRCSRLTVLVTSRAPLRLRAEHLQPLPPLPLPTTTATGLDELSASPAITLLVQRTAAVRPGFALTSANAEALTALCRRLDGLPLAIELAAAQLSTLDPQRLLTELSARLPDLPGAVDMPDRHQTLRLTVEWSTERLADAERQLLGVLAAFAGGAAPAAVESILDTAGVKVPNVHGSVAQLAAGSLIGIVDRNGEARITMLDTIREVAADRLVLPEVRGAHSAYFLELLRTGSDQADAERDNVRAGVSWAVTQQPELLDVALARGLAGYHLARAQFGEANRTLRAIAGATSDDTVRAWALHGASVASNESGDSAEALRTAEECAALFDKLGDALGQCTALTVAGNAQKFLGRYAEARESHQASLALARETADQRRVTISLNNLGTLAHDSGEYDTAQEHYLASLAIKEELGDVRGSAVTRMNLAGVENDLGAYELSHDHLQSAVAAFRGLNDTSPTAYALGMLSEAQLGLGQEAEAQASATEALDMAREAEYRPGIGLALARLGDLALARGNHAEAATLLLQALDHANGRPEQARTLERLAAARSVTAPAEAAQFRERAQQLRRTFDLPVPPIDQR